MSNSKLKILNYSVAIITLSLFFLLVFNPNIYVSFITAIITFALIALLTFLCGIKVDKKETYKNNITIYIILYFIFLFFLTMFVGRYNTPLINIRNGYLRYINIIPFKTIIRYLTNKVSLSVIIYNIIDNFGLNKFLLVRNSELSKDYNIKSDDLNLILEYNYKHYLNYIIYLFNKLYKIRKYLNIRNSVIHRVQYLYLDRNIISLNFRKDVK